MPPSFIWRQRQLPIRALAGTAWPCGSSISRDGAESPRPSPCCGIGHGVIADLRKAGQPVDHRLDAGPPVLPARRKRESPPAQQRQRAKNLSCPHAHRDRSWPFSGGVQPFRSAVGGMPITLKPASTKCTSPVTPPARSLSKYSAAPPTWLSSTVRLSGACALVPFEHHAGIAHRARRPGCASARPRWR